jgi:hypothetical protein
MQNLCQIVLPKSMVILEKISRHRGVRTVQNRLGIKNFILYLNTPHNCNFNLRYDWTMEMLNFIKNVTTNVTRPLKGTVSRKFRIRLFLNHRPRT